MDKQQLQALLSGQAFIRMAKVLKEQGVDMITPDQLEDMGRRIISIHSTIEDGIK